MPATIRIGTSGWSYPDWVGPFYPRTLTDRGRWLSHYATILEAVEVNSTYYRLPSATTVTRWSALGRAHPDFRLSLKVPQRVTHEFLLRGDIDGSVASFEEFYGAVARPLLRTRMLAALLLQLPPGQRWEGEQPRLLARLLDRLPRKVPCVIEPRHPSWYHHGRLRPNAAALLQDSSVSCAWVDGPHLPAACPRTGPLTYLRLHGRNDDVWDHPGAGATPPRGGTSLPADPRGRVNRYDYRYTATELRPWVQEVANQQHGDAGVLVFFNNHPGAQSAINAMQFRRMLSGEPD